MDEVPIGNMWRRAPCIGCGEVVKRARDAHAFMIGTRSGSWTAALGPRAGRIFADTTEFPTDEPVLMLGVTQISCGPRALRNLKAGAVELPTSLPLVLADAMHPDDPALNLQIPTPANTCPFCEEFERDPSEEDIFPKWLLKELVAKGARFKNGNLWSPKPVGPVTYACQDCNNTWMSTLENDAKPVIRKLIYEACDLTAAEQEILAEWATMKAILIDSGSKNPVVPRGFGRDLKIQRTPHDGVQIWIAAFHDLQPLLAALPRLIYASQDSEDPNRIIAYCVTIVVFRLIVQILIPFYPGCPARPNNFNGCVIPVWPNPEDASWPPRHYFDREALDALAVRIYDNREPLITTVTLRETPIGPPGDTVAQADRGRLEDP